MEPDLCTWLLEQIAEDERRALAVCMHSREATARLGGDRWTGRRSEAKPEDIVELWASIGALRPHFTGLAVPVSTNLSGYLEVFDPARVLAECEAKRALIMETIRPFIGRDNVIARNAAIALRLLAWPYADRPGYRQEWKPTPERLTH